MKSKTKSKPQPQPLTLPDGVDPMLRNELEMQLLKYTAGRLMTCPGCGQLLDCQRTTVFSVYGVPETKVAEELVANFVQCTACWDKRGAGSLASILKLTERRPDLKIRTELVDGRVVFPTKKA